MDNSSLIPKFIICKKGTNLDNLPISNYFRINEYDSLKNDANDILLKNDVFITKSYAEKGSAGDFNRFITHFLTWKYIYDNSLEYAIIIEDNVRIFASINKNINSILQNVPEQFDYVGMYLNNRDLEQSNGEIEIATEVHQPHAYLITMNGARRLLKLTRLWKINRSLDKQIFYYIKQKFLRGYIIKKQFLYSNKIEYQPVLIKGIKDEFIKPDGLTMKEVQEIEAELLKFKQIGVSVDVIDKLLEVESKDEAIIQKMKETTESKDEDIIIQKISGRLNEKEDDEFIEKLSKKLYEILELEL
jgi:GR25 family glycosyltransferase involved in LPS biosynthesis